LLDLDGSAERPPRALSIQQQKQRTIEAMVDLLDAAAQRTPALLVVEDVHWIDPSTLELLGRLVTRAVAAPILTILSSREDFPLSWTGATDAGAERITLDKLTAEDTRVLVRRLTEGKTVPADTVDQIVARADGVPLFVEELSKAVVDAGSLVGRDDRQDAAHWLRPRAIPSTLQGSLRARLDRLGPASELAELAATVGREFGYDLIHAVSDSDDPTLRKGLARLVEAGVLVERGSPPTATYTFKHALIQDAAYESLLKTRRQEYHRRIARTLSTAFPAIAENQPEVLARHHTAAGSIADAVAAWHRAGQRAFARSANVEAIAHFTKALELLDALPTGPQRIERELVLRASLGPALMNVKGYAAPEVAATWERARKLCRRVGRTAQLFPVLWGLWAFYLVRARLDTADKLALQLQTLARRLGDARLGVGARYASGNTAFWRGHLTLARRQLRNAAHRGRPTETSLLALYGEDPTVTALAYLSHTQWLLGYPDQALATSERACALARSIAHPHSMAFALVFAAGLHQYRNEPVATRTAAEAVIALATEQGFPQWQGVGAVLGGWATAVQGEARGVEMIREGLALWRAIGANVSLPYWLGLLGAAHEHLGQPLEGLAVTDEALQMARAHGEHHYVAELYRQKGEFVLALGRDARQAERYFRQALATARRCRVRSLELRTALSLARLLRGQGRRLAARRVVAEVYRRFSEGFDTADLTSARKFLTETA
jgi:tetratricopeptide (TPR) repeat protein